MAEKEKRIPISDDPDRLSKPASRLLGHISDGRLCIGYTDDERVPSGFYYWIEPGGRKANAGAAQELLRKNRLTATGDGLFGESQSFVVAERANV